MTAAQAQDWMIPLALTVAILAGLLIVLLSIRVSLVKSVIAITTITYAFLGAILILAPKWHSLSAKYDAKTGSASVEVASLQNRLDDSLKENASLRTQIALVQSLDNKSVTASDWLSSAKQIKADVDWAKFLPTDPTKYKVQVPIDDFQTIAAIAGKLGKPQAEVGLALKDVGLIFLKDFSPTDSKTVLAKDLWISGYNK